jgi:bacteriocin-like protein
MMTFQEEKNQFIELNTKELNQTNGGSILSAIDATIDSAIGALKAGGAWGYATIWFGVETIMNPGASYDAFMRGWNACK